MKFMTEKFTIGSSKCWRTYDGWIASFEGKRKTKLIAHVNDNIKTAKFKLSTLLAARGYR